MYFEYDVDKSISNKEKHGIDFKEAKKLWKSEPLKIPAKTVLEPRFQCIGKIDDKYWSAIITLRDSNILELSL